MLGSHHLSPGAMELYGWVHSALCLSKNTKEQVRASDTLTSPLWDKLFDFLSLDIFAS